MCPKLKPEKVILHRFELQQTERDALEMVAASMTVRNIGEGVGSIISPFLKMSAASGIVLSSILAAIAAKAAADKALDIINPEGVGGVTTRIATSPWFIGFVADARKGLDKIAGFGPL